MIECGQHWERRSADLAIEACWRFLAATKVVSEIEAQSHFSTRWQEKQKLLEVTQALTIASDDFRFIADFEGLETFPKSGTLIAYDGPQPILTPYDNCVLLMPSRRLTKGASAARLGRYININ